MVLANPRGRGRGRRPAPEPGLVEVASGEVKGRTDREMLETVQPLDAGTLSPCY